MSILRTLAIPFVLLSVIGLAACETVEGAGEDIENAGEGIQDAAD
ncbi:entericidin A/B family lipoprotein [Hwanghaeella grinnelliae]|uniref:Entericidin A/B family lipoprotein n=1 Tax=Hwanghaeella grinnelliae TaxID=2500179 RepID=A0A437QX19_9PROT|nr:entericidin A/B family lipoprotein [Hwanghaeella grinnelliae]RVU39075.1 entericidin A/B family lipoprotein [Hwanghaeella grinnelliae]